MNKKPQLHGKYCGDCIHFAEPDRMIARCDFYDSRFVDKNWPACEAGYLHYEKKYREDKQCKDCIYFWGYEGTRASRCIMNGLELLYHGEQGACVKYFVERKDK